MIAEMLPGLPGANDERLISPSTSMPDDLTKDGSLKPASSAIMIGGL
jgi:hypothetical protein